MAESNMTALKLLNKVKTYSYSRADKITIEEIATDRDCYLGKSTL